MRWIFSVSLVAALAVAGGTWSMLAPDAIAQNGPVGPADLTFRGGWTATTNYVTDDLVTARGSAWRARRASLNKVPGSTSPSTSADWQLFAGGLNPLGNWSSATTYHAADLASHLGQTFRAKRTNINKPPTTSTADWNLFAAKGDPGPSSISNGSVTSPAIKFSTSTNTGIFAPSAGQIAMVAGGSLLLHHQGTNNTALGVAALDSNTGADNTALGTNALTANTSGNNNTAIGSNAMAASTTGIRNAAFGSEALLNLTSGGANTAIGDRALAELITGNSNVAIGQSAGTGTTSSATSIFIANIGQTGDTKVMRIGALGNQTRSFIAGIRGVTTDSNTAIPVLIDSNGQLGTVSSSRRYKEDIATMGDMSATLSKLRPVTFRYIQPFTDGAKPIQYGLIAEEVAETFPDLAVTDEQGRPETVKYHLLPPLLLAGHQEQQRVIDSQAREISAQAAHNEQQQRMIDAQAAQLAALSQRLAALEAQRPRETSVQPAMLRAD